MMSGHGHDVREIVDAPGGRPLVGHLPQLHSDRIAFLERVALAGDLVRIRVGRRQVIAVSEPSVAHELLVERARTIDKSPSTRILLYDVAGRGLFTSGGELWQRQRRMMSPLFRPAALSGYVRAMNEEALLARARMTDGARLDLAQEMMRITMGVVGRCLFGAQTLEQADRVGHALTVALGWVNRYIGSRSLTAQLFLLEGLEGLEGKLPAFVETARAAAVERLLEPWLLAGRRDPALVEALGVLDAHTREMIAERRANPTGRSDLLTRLLLARDGELGGEGMSDAQVRDEVSTLFIAGHETTAAALAWALYLLSRNPRARARVQAEADALGPDGPTSFDPQALGYTTRVLKETLRIYPPLPAVTRRNREPLELGGHVLPERTLLVVNIYGMHRRPDVYADPHRFDPDRFVPEQEAKRHKAAWIPFSLGPRVCIGNHFALMEGAVVLATLMRGLRFEVEPREVEPEQFATLRPKGGVWATVHRRRA